MLLFSLLLVGCPDPTAVPEGAGPGMQLPPGPGAGGEQGPPPPPGDAGGPGGGAPSMPTLTVPAGTGVLLSGEFVYTGATTGHYRVDFFQVGPDGRPNILHAMMLEKVGHWELEVPKGLGKIDMLAFVDTEGNGPQLAEPSALLVDVIVGQEPISTLNFTLVDGAPNAFATDSPTLANLPAGGGPPPGGQAPPDGAGMAPPDGKGPPGGAMAPGELPPKDAKAPSTP